MAILDLTLGGATATGYRGELSEGFTVHIDFAQAGLARVALIPKAGPAVDRTWMIAPDGDVTAEGRSRLSLAGFCPPEISADGDRFGSHLLRFEVKARPFQLTVQHRVGEKWHTCMRDRHLGAYLTLPERGEIRHYQARRAEDRHYGLGDKAGPVDRTRRRFKCLQTDALGYDAELSDPLYKHAPFMIIDHPEHGAAGVLYDSLAELEFDFGSEHSNYFEPFRQVAAREDCLIYWVLAGPRVRDVVPRLMALCGGQAMPPRAALGFGFSAMGHTDSENAQAVILDFARTCRREAIPISAIHLGSGYSLHGAQRHVFEWNEDRFPDRSEFFEEMAAMGYHICANIKPVLLENHPHYARGNAGGWFVRKPGGQPVVERFWDGWGSQLDFTNPDTRDWWRHMVHERLLSVGVGGIWNDNNEAELWDETARLDGDGKPFPAVNARPVHALLMVQASRDAAAGYAPDRRPHMITRAGPIGIARYGETWSGDNHTNWHTLKWNLRQGLSMSLSGFPLTGHDVGGFSGPAPDPELLVRWFQMMALHPRAVMNSWKPETKYGANLPFMYRHVLTEIKAALAIRYRFLPHLYQLLWRCCREGHPIIAPVFYGYDDPVCLGDHDMFLLGDSVVVAPIVDQNRSRLEVYLPQSEEPWFRLDYPERMEGGAWHSLDVCLATLPIFVRSGTILVLASQWPSTHPHDATALEVHLFVGETDGSAEAEFFWDDGVSPIDPENVFLSRMDLTWDGGTVRLHMDNRTGLEMSVVCHGLADRQLIETTA